MLFNIISTLRNILYNYKFLKINSAHIPVISVGNITAGGTGKTPFTIALANLFVENGYQPAIITRGYKRTSKGQVVASNGAGPLASVAECGDEPWLMSQKTTNVVIIADKNRFSAAQTAQDKHNCNVIICDDGFQHRRLKRDADIVLWDSTTSPNNEKLLPVGRLRESFRCLKRADYLVFTRSEKFLDSYIQFFEKYNLEFALSQTRISQLLNKDNQVEPSRIYEEKVLAFCGLGNPVQFFDTIKKLKPQLLLTKAFADHHKYSEKQMEDLLDFAVSKECKYLITTEKDYTNIPSVYKESNKIIVVSIEMHIDDKLFSSLLKLIK